MMAWTDQITTFDERRDLAVPGDKNATLDFCVDHFLAVGEAAIQKRGSFFVALSGGSTPKAIFEQLARHKARLDWSKVHLFWSDERSVPPGHADSNYKMAMEAGFTAIALPTENIHRMVAEEEIEENAAEYQALIEKLVPDAAFDLIMLGMGDDGHTASLFPNTQALAVEEALVVANFVSQKETWRMTFTYPLLDQARHVTFYALGEGKAPMVEEVLNGEEDHERLPSQRVGTPDSKALWILDSAAAKRLKL